MSALNPVRHALSWLAMLLLLGMLAVTAVHAQDDEQENTPTITWWVVGGGGILNAVSDDGDTLSGTLGQVAIDSTALDDSTYSKMIAYGYTQPRPSAWLGFWLPKQGRLDASDPLPTTTGNDNTLALANHPNPFNDRTTISYLLPVDGDAQLEIFDGTGKRVRLLIAGAASAGTHRVVWDGTDDSGGKLSSGAYFYRLEVRSGTTQNAGGMMNLMR
jgi:hypothetical protein